MPIIPAIPQEHLDISRSLQADQRWHKFAFEMFPAPFGNNKLLDVGCGGGGVVVKATGLGWSATGIDIAPRNVDSLRNMGFDAEVVDLNGVFPFPDQSFSCVTFIEVAEHLVRAEHTLSEISRVLLSGGCVLFTTPNNASYRRRIKALKGRAPDDEGYHYRFWVRKQLEEKLRKAGLYVAQANSYGYLPIVDTISLYKTITGRRRVFRVTRRYEPLFADRFVWLLRKY